MNPRQFLQLASSLAQQQGPAELRTAIGRAYYAVYHVAVQFVEELGFHVSRGPGGHGDVRAWMANTGEQELADVGFALAELHGKRIQADYRLDRKTIENVKEARETVARADALIQSLDVCRKEPRRGRIQNSLRAFHQRMRGQTP